MQFAQKAKKDVSFFMQMLYNRISKKSKGVCFMNIEKKCTAICPLCGSDLSFMDNECICKNKECSWHCDGCKSEDDI